MQGGPGREPVDKLAVLQAYWAQVDPQQRYFLPPEDTILRLAVESGLDRGQVARFFERRLLPLPDPLAPIEPVLEPWDFGLSGAADASDEQAEEKKAFLEELERTAEEAQQRSYMEDFVSVSDKEEDEERDTAPSDDSEDGTDDGTESEEEDVDYTSSEQETSEDDEETAEAAAEGDEASGAPPEYSKSYLAEVVRMIKQSNKTIARAKAAENKIVEDKRRAILYKELEAKLIREREEEQWVAQIAEDDQQLRKQEEGAADARSPSLIDAIVQGQVGAAELSSLTEMPADAAAPAAQERPVALEKPRRKGRVKTVRARKRKKRRYFWLVLKGTRTPGMRSKLFEGEWVEQMDKYDLDQAKTPEERAFMEQANEEFQKELKRPLPSELRSFNDLPFLPIEHDIVYQHEDWEADCRIAHRSLEVGDILSGVVVDQYLHAGAFVDCCCEYNGIVWVSEQDWPGVEDVIELGRAVDVVVTAVRDPALYRFPLELQCVDPDMTGLLPNTRAPTDAPLVFPIDTTEADLERIAEITGREYLSPSRYARLKQEWRRYRYRGSQFLEQPRRVKDNFTQRHGMRPPAFPYPARPFRPARAPSTKKKTRKASDDDSFNDEPAGGDDGEYSDESRSARWEE